MKLPKFIQGKKHDPILSIRFVVLFNIAVLGFQSVSGINANVEKEFIQEGGRNGYPIALKSQQKSPFKITFSRGYVMRRAALTNLIGVNPFTNIDAWKDKALGTILVLDTDREVKAIYTFVSDGALEWSLSDLTANRSDQLIETFTITHHGLVNVPIPTLLQS